MAFAQTIEFRFKLPEISSTTPLSQSLLVNRTGSTNTSTQFGVYLEYTGSLSSGSYSGSIVDQYYQYGNLKFIHPDAGVSASIYLPFFNGNWWSVMITKKDDPYVTYDLYAASKTLDEYGQYVIQYQGSSSLQTPFDWKKPGNVLIPGSGSSTILGKTYVPATGSFQELRYYNVPLSESQFNDYVVNSNSIEGNTLDSSYDELFFRAALGGELFTGSTSIHPSVNTTASFDSGNSNFGYTGSYSFISNTEIRYYDQVPSGIKNAVSQKIQQQNIVLPYSSSKNNIPNNNVLSPFISVQQSPSISQSYTRDIDYVEVGFSPQNEINDDINDQLGYFNIGEFIGDPRQISSSADSYPDLDGLRDSYFKKYSKDYQEWDYIRLIQFFDNSLFKTVSDWVPARTSLAAGIIIKQHLLERNKYPVPQAEISTSIANVASGSTNIPFYQENILFTGSIPMGTITGSDGGTLPNMNGQTSSVILPSNYNTTVTQVWNGTNIGPLGIVPFTDSYQTEFFDGELSGSVITVTTQSLNPNNILLNNQAFYSTVADYQDLDVNTISGSYNISNTFSILPISFSVLNRYIDYYNTSSYQYKPIFDSVTNVVINITGSSYLGLGDIIEFSFNEDNNIISSEGVTGIGSFNTTINIPNFTIKSGSTYNVTYVIYQTSILTISASISPLTNWTVNVVNPQTIGYPNDPNIYQQSSFPGNLELYSEYNAILNNVYSNRLSDKYFDVDYSQQGILPVNQQVIISQSAVYAQIQDSNYTLARNINPRYVGSKNTSAKYNIYTVGDSSYGKKAAIDTYVNYFAYWDWRGGSNPQYPGGGNIHLTYLIDIEGNAIPLTGDNTWLETVSNIFVKNQTAYILPVVYSSGDPNIPVTIIEGGAIYDTIIVKSGSANPALNSNIDIQYENNPFVPAPGATTYDDIYFQTSSITTLIDTGSSPSPTSGWLSSMISGSSPVLGKVILYGFDNDIIQIYNKNTGRFVTGGNDIILYEDTYFPLQVGDFIRFGSDVGGSTGLDYSFSQQLYAIKTLTLGTYDDISSLEVIPIVTGSFPAAQDKQNFRIMRRVPKDNFVLVKNIPSYTGGGLLIPENFNPNFNPYDLARKAGLIQ